MRFSSSCLFLGWIALLFLSTLAGLAQEAPSVLVWESAFESSENDEIRWPVAVAASGAEAVVADAFKSRLIFFQEEDVFRSQGNLRLQSTPVALAHDGDLWWLALRNGDLLTFRQFSDEPEKVALPTQVALRPTVLAAWNGNVFVVDGDEKRVLRLSASGDIDREQGITDHVQALATDGSTLFAALPVTGQVRKYLPSSSEGTNWRIPGRKPRQAWPAALTLANENLYVADRQGGRVLVLDTSGRVIGQGGRRGWDRGELLQPSAIAAFGDGRLAVADLGNSRVLVFRHLQQ